MTKETPINHFKFTLSKNKIMILNHKDKYKNKDKIINIPENIKIEGNKYKVTHIGCGLIQKNSNVEQIILPESLEQIISCSILNCENLKSITIPKNIENIGADNFIWCPNLQLEEFENQFIKIKNNNVYQKELENNKIIYYLTNSIQKEGTLILQDNERIKNINNFNIKKINMKKQNEIGFFSLNCKNLETIIASEIEFIDKNAIIETEALSSLYITNKCKEIKDDSFCVTNLYYDGTRKEFDKIKFNTIGANHIVLKKDVKELGEMGFQFGQINQILRGYEKSILLTNIDKNISEETLRNIVNNFTYQDFELYDLYQLLEKDQTLDVTIEIEKIINKKILENIKNENTRNQIIR